MKVGFVGLGNMGGPMAGCLVRAGHEVTGFDPVAACPEGVRPATGAAEAAAGAEVVITMLPDGAVLRAVAAGVIPAMKPGAVLLDCSTVDVATARAVAAQAVAAGLRAVDAPVSGGIAAAAQGSLTFMAGGPADAVEAVRPLLEAMGQRVVHCGDAGAGQAAKVCNNMILGATMAVTCEAFALADRLGLDRQALYDVVSAASGQSWSLTSYCPAPGVGPQTPADRDYRPGFAAALMLKDLRLSQQAADAGGLATPLGAAATAVYARLVEEAGLGDADFSVLLKWLGDGGAADPRGRT